MGPSKRRNSANDNGSGTMARRAVRGGNGFMLLMRVEKEKGQDNAMAKWCGSIWYCKKRW